MYRMTTMLALGMLSFQASARNGFYISPSIGAGISSQKQKYFSPDQISYSPDTKNAFSYNAQLGIGYSYKKWRLETGLQYAVTGYKYTDIILGINFPDMGEGTIETRYQHLSLPLRIGYTVGLSDKLSLAPYAGIIASYNLGARTVTKFSPEPKSDYRWQSKDFKNYYNSSSLWGNLALRLEYKVNNRLSILGGPTVQYMISNFMKIPDGAIYKASERMFLVNMDFGVKYNLAKS